MTQETHQKVKAAHLQRNAYLYIRQSTLRQVFENSESTKRQYALRQKASALGWPEDRIVVIDSDLGQSGASAADREGFQRLVTEVSLGRAGIVLGLEVSRLARNSTDWHRLLEICALSDALILDEDGVYDPAHFNERLLLGLKGTMSEAELHVLRARLQGGILNKARRGELFIRPPVGLIYNSEGGLVLDPDKQVQDALRCLFDTFRRTGSAMATVRCFASCTTRDTLGPSSTVGRILEKPWMADSPSCTFRGINGRRCFREPMPAISVGKITSKIRGASTKARRLWERIAARVRHGKDQRYSRGSSSAAVVESA